MHGVKHFPVGLEEGALSDLDVLILVGVAQVPGGLRGRQVRRVGLLEPVRVQLWLQMVHIFKAQIVATLPVGHVGHLGRHGDGAGHDQVVVVVHLDPLLRRAL